MPTPRETYIKKQRDLASKKCTQYQKMRKAFLLLNAELAEQETDEQFVARTHYPASPAVSHV